MENEGLIFIPDISGFSNFVSNIELTHSRHVIQELLEVLIDSNSLELEVSEIEGDAILFYKFGKAPVINLIFDQVKKMFVSFHDYLKIYEKLRTCPCNACVSAINLSLKVITHYGEFTRYQVKNFDKLIGKDLIIAHQLLKNEIDHHEYWLMTHSIMENVELSELDHKVKWYQGRKLTEQGETSYAYTLLTTFRQ